MRIFGASTLPRAVRVSAATVGGLSVLLMLLSVNTLPVVGNDGVIYISHSLDLGASGVVRDGFRQVGYPMALTMVRFVADAFGAEPILAMVVVQRGLVVLACVLAVWMLRWWSLPLVVFLTTPGNIAYTGFILTEGLGLPLGVLTMLCVIAYVDLVQRDPAGQHKAASALLLVGVTSGCLALLALRFTYVVFALVPIVLIVVSWRGAHRGRALVACGVFVAASAAFIVAMALENQRELGVASPSTGGLPGEYFYAWQRVFHSNPENWIDPDLARFYDDGVVHDFSRQVTATGIPYAEQGSVYRAEIDAMLSEAGLSKSGTQFEAMLWSLVGGRFHDVEGVISNVLSSTESDVRGVTYVNQFAATNGIQAFADEYNNGSLIGAVVTNPAGVPAPALSGHGLTSLLLPLAIIVMGFGLISNETRSMAVIGLIVVIGTAVGLGVIRADNYRFLIVSSAAGIAVASSLLPSITRSSTSISRRAQRGLRAST